jgi:hypothetical protein
LKNALAIYRTIVRDELEPIFQMNQKIEEVGEKLESTKCFAPEKKI